MEINDNKNFIDKMFYNTIALISIAILYYMILFYNQGLMLAFYNDVICFIISCPVSIVLYKRNPILSKILVLICLNLVLYVPTIGIGFTDQNYYFCLIMLNTIFFQKKEIKWSYIAYMITTVFFILTVYQVDIFQMGRWVLPDNFDMGSHWRKNALGSFFLSAILAIILRKNVTGVANNYVKEEGLRQKELLNQQKNGYQQAKMASLGELSSGIAHEINNPLAFINGYCLKLKKECPEKKEVLDKIISGVDRISKVIQWLQCFSDAKGKEKEEFYIKKAVCDIHNIYEKIYEKDGINLKLEILLDDDDKVFYDRGKFQQILIQLLSNAKDALDESSIKEIEIKLDKINMKHILTVIDSGCGIDKNTQNKIFDPFFTTKSSGKGTGIGMGVVLSYVNEMNGKIDFNSELGKGTSFKIVF